MLFLFISFLFIGIGLGLIASIIIGRDEQKYAAPSIEAKPLKFVPSSLSCPK